MASKRKPSGRVIAYRNCFSTEDGQYVLKDLMKTHYILGTTVSNDGKDLLREGERNAVLRILHFLEITEERLLQMIKEDSE